MATVSQLKIQQSRGVRYTGGEAILPPEVQPEPPPTLVISQGTFRDGTDLGVVKVQGDELVFDTDDFNPGAEPARAMAAESALSTRITVIENGLDAGTYDD